MCLGSKNLIIRGDLKYLNINNEESTNVLGLFGGGRIASSFKEYLNIKVIGEAGETVQALLNALKPDGGLKEQYNGNKYYTLANIEEFIKDVCESTLDIADKKNVFDTFDADLPEAQIEEKISLDVSNIINDLLKKAIDEDHCVAGEIYADEDTFYNKFWTPLSQKLDVELTKKEEDYRGAEA